jgi:hypothetical protein
MADELRGIRAFGSETRVDDADERSRRPAPSSDGRRLAVGFRYRSAKEKPP